MHGKMEFPIYVLTELFELEGIQQLDFKLTQVQLRSAEPLIKSAKFSGCLYLTQNTVHGWNYKILLWLQN